LRVDGGLSGLLQLVAAAVGLAGGDEVAALARMERLAVAGGAK